MNLHIVLWRELLIACKRPGTFHLRTVIAALAAVAAFVVVRATIDSIIAPGQAGPTLLRILGALGMFWALFEGVMLTFDSISRERREGTLGLLFLSNLTGHDIVAGKAAGAGLRTLFALMAAAPAPALTFLFGGVTTADYIKLMLVLLNALFFALSLGLLVSSLGEYLRQTKARGLLLLLWFIVCAPVIAIFLHKQGYTLTALVTGSSPLIPFLILIAQDAALDAIFPSALAISNFLAWIMLLAAGNHLERTWRITDDESAVQERRLSRAIAIPKAGNPIQWIAFKQSGPLRIFWINCVVAAALLAVILPLAKLEQRIWVAAVAVIWLHLMLSSEVWKRACKALAEARQSGLLELLLTTPLSEEDVTHGHLIALKQRAARGLGFLLLLDIAWLICASRVVTPGTWLFVLLMYPCFLAAHVLEMTLSARWGLWNGLRLGNSPRGLRKIAATSALGGFGIVALAFAVHFTLTPVLSSATNALLLAITVTLLLWAQVFGLAGNVVTWLTDRFRETASRS